MISKTHIKKKATVNAYNPMVEEVNTDFGLELADPPAKTNQRVPNLSERRCLKETSQVLRNDT